MVSKKNTTKKEDHLEVSEGSTKIVSSANCPLNEAEGEQLFLNNKFEHVICCFICYTGGHGTQDFCCPGFYGAIYSENKGFQVDCRMN